MAGTSQGGKDVEESSAGTGTGTRTGWFPPGLLFSTRAKQGPEKPDGFVWFPSGGCPAAGEVIHKYSSRMRMKGGDVSVGERKKFSRRRLFGLRHRRLKEKQVKQSMR